MIPGHCPFSTPEFEVIRKKHANLASTGCTTDFCQAGRLLHTDESRVGENRAIHVVQQEALDFLQELHREDFFHSENDFHERCVEVLAEIRAGAVDGVGKQDHSVVQVGGAYTQTKEELTFGIRRAWRNSRKCIMRSHCEELQLCDLRAVTTSAHMASELMFAVNKAYNGGNILPTVFVFPPRKANGRGPMIWNNQILQFAGYDVGDGVILGDPASVQLTKAILELGWEPPQKKTRWDLLPLVVMAEGDHPVLIEIPPDIGRLVEIRHPHYVTAFKDLGLKWVPFPALTRLGFDIGGIQYTAAPFIGWFMDAEIGVRNLADTFRYNVLPDIINALNLAHGKFTGSIEEFDDLPEYEKLAMLSRAQTELNYAVHWSYLQANINMTDTLTASMKYCRYDDAFKEMHGHRLPADPYWLAPPQGSIIPIWHRGGAPNYQPKPMICRHVQDPIKAWQREKGNWPHAMNLQRIWIQSRQSSDQLITIVANTPAPADEIIPQPKILIYDEPHQTLQKGLISLLPGMAVCIYFCSTGTIAERLAIKIWKWIRTLVGGASSLMTWPQVKPLNSLTVEDLCPEKLLLLVVSSTGKGEIPVNGSKLQKLWYSGSLSTSTSFRFAVFGNGDSRYSNTYNGAATKIDAMMSKMGGISLIGTMYHGDVATEPFPLRALQAWWRKLQPAIVQWSSSPRFTVLSCKDTATVGVIVTISAIDDPVEKYIDFQKNVLSTLSDGLLVGALIPRQIPANGSLLLTLNIGQEIFHELSCVQVSPSNAEAKVRQALYALRVHDSMPIDLEGSNPSFFEFLSYFVDLELPFLQLEWLEYFHSQAIELPSKEVLSTLSVLQVLLLLLKVDFPKPDLFIANLQREICLDMPILQTRTYSIASSTRKVAHHNSTGSGQQIDIMVKVYSRGRFSNTFLNDCALPRALKYRIVDSIAGPKLRKNHMAPFIVVATGAGFGPVRCLLQWRIAIARESIAAGKALQSWVSDFSIFLGLRECDLPLVIDVLNDAMSVNLIDILDIVVSNPEKRRVYDNLQLFAQQIRRKIMGRQGAVVYVCASGAAAKGAKSVFEQMLGANVEDSLGERYVEEVF